jgi:hypothetical protein
MNFTPQSAMQRIQVGLIGLVAVLLFVSIANMIFDRNANRDGVASKDATSETKASETRDWRNWALRQRFQDSPNLPKRLNARQGANRRFPCRVLIETG